MTILDYVVDMVILSERESRPDQYNNSSVVMMESVAVLRSLSTLYCLLFGVKTRN